MREQDYVNASELAQFAFCKRSWLLARQKRPSLNEGLMARGVQFHERHSDRVQAAPRAGRIANRWAIVLAVLLVLWLLWAFR